MFDLKKQAEIKAMIENVRKEAAEKGRRLELKLMLKWIK